MFLADAGARWIRRYDREGNFLNNIGDQHRKGGFHIPNGVVDFDVDEQGIVHVANPGMHRVERYTADGEYLGLLRPLRRAGSRGLSRAAATRPT